MAPTRVIIDTDPGLDDTAAILFTLACPERVTVEMLTTVFGNTAIEQHDPQRPDDPGRGRPDRHPGLPGRRPAAPARAALRAAHPQRRTASAGWRRSIRQRARFGRASPPSRSSSTSWPRPARSPWWRSGRSRMWRWRCAWSRGSPSSVREIVLMGGAVRVPGNVSPVASANMLNDPDAAAVVYSSGAPIVQAGLDVARPTIITPAHLARIAAADTPAARLLTRRRQGEHRLVHAQPRRRGRRALQRPADRGVRRRSDAVRGRAVPGGDRDDRDLHDRA